MLMISSIKQLIYVAFSVLLEQAIQFISIWLLNLIFVISCIFYFFLFFFFVFFNFFILYLLLNCVLRKVRKTKFLFSLFFFSPYTSIIEAFANGEFFDGFFVNDKFWGLLPNTLFARSSFSYFRPEDLVDWLLYWMGSPTTSWAETDYVLFEMFDIYAYVGFFCILILLHILYDNIFRNSFFPIYYFFGIDEEDNDFEETSSEEDWGDEHDEEEGEDEEDDDTEAPEDDALDIYSLTKQQEYEMEWYKLNHPLMYYHLLFSRALALSWNPWDEEVSTYHWEDIDSGIEDSDEELEPEEWETEFDYVVVFIGMSVVEGWYIGNHKTQVFQSKKPLYWLIDAEKIRVLAAGDLFVFNHTVSHFSEIFSDIWNNYVISSWQTSEEFFNSQENYLKLYWDNLLVNPEDALSYNQIFLKSDASNESVDLMSFNQWAMEWHTTKHQTTLNLQTTAPPVKFIDLNKVTKINPFVEYTKHKSLQKLLLPSFDDNVKIYEDNKFSQHAYILYISNLQKKLDLKNFDFLTRYDWNKRSLWKWMRIRSISSADEINNLIEHFKQKKSRRRPGFRRRMKRALLYWLPHSRIHLGDYLMFLNAYRFHYLRRMPRFGFHRQYSRTSPLAFYPRIFPFGQTFSFFAPDTFPFLQSRLENQYNLEYWNYLRFRYYMSYTNFKKRRRFGSTTMRYIASTFERPGHLLRDYLSIQPQKLSDYKISLTDFKPSEYLKLNGEKFTHYKKYYHDDIIGFGGPQGLFLLNDSFWYKWIEMFYFSLNIEEGKRLPWTNGFILPDAGILTVPYWLFEHAAVQQTRGWDFFQLFHYEGRTEHVMLHDHYRHFLIRKPKLHFVSMVEDLRSVLRKYIFLQAYVDVLQSKYGSIVGLFMFHSPGNSLNTLSKILFNFTIDYSWYTKTHYLELPDQSFSAKDVKACQYDMFGFSDDTYSLFEKDYDNPLSILPFPEYYQDLSLAEADTDEWLAIEKDLFKFWKSGDQVEDSTTVSGFPFLESKKWPIIDPKKELTMQSAHYARILNNYRPYSSKNSLVLNMLIDPVGLLLTQRRLYKPWLSLKTSFLPPNSNFFPVFKYFKNFLQIPDFSYLDKKWNIFIFLKQQEEKLVLEFKKNELVEPKEDFFGHFFFAEFSDYYVSSPFSSFSLFPNLYFFNFNIKENSISEKNFISEDFCGSYAFSSLENYSLIFQVYWKSWELLFTKTSFVLSQILKKTDPIETYLQTKRQVFLPKATETHVNYVDDLPPFEDFIQNFDVSFWDRITYYSWPKKEKEFSWFTFFNITPPFFEEFDQMPNLEFSYTPWKNAQKILFDDYFSPQLKTWWKKAKIPAIQSFTKEIDFSKGGNYLGRPHSLEANQWFIHFYVDFYESYVSDIPVTRKYFPKGWLRRVDNDLFFESKEVDFDDMWTIFFGDDDELNWILMPYLKFFPLQAGSEHNDFYPYDASEFNHIIHGDPFIIMHDLDVTDVDELDHGKIREDFEVPFSLETDDIAFPDYRNSPYTDDREDDVFVDDEELWDPSEEFITQTFVLNFWPTQYQMLLNHSICLNKVDWITRLALIFTGIYSDEEGSFHFKKRIPKSIYGLESMDDHQLKRKANSSDVFWNEEDLEEGVSTSYVYPLGKKGVWQGGKGFLPMTLGTFKKGLSCLYPEGIEREDDSGEWWYDDLDIFDWFQSELRHGNALAQTSVDGDFFSFEPSIYHEDFVFYHQLFPFRRVSFTREKGFFPFFERMEEEDDMDCFEMAWEEEDDVYVHNPYIKCDIGQFVEICPGKAKAFIARVFPTPAWHGYPIPLDLNGWVAASWLWRFSKCNDLSYRFEYWAETNPRNFFLNATTKSFWSYFSDTFGSFIQSYSGTRKRYAFILDNQCGFNRLSRDDHNLALAKGIGADLSFIFRFHPEETIMDSVEVDDNYLTEDNWDDEEHPMETYEEGCEFTHEEYLENAETFSQVHKNLMRGNTVQFHNRSPTHYNVLPKDPLYEEDPDPDTHFEFQLTGTSMAFLDSFDFFKNTHFSLNRLPLCWDKHMIKFNQMELQEFPWKIYNFIGERDANLTQISDVTTPYMYEDPSYLNRPFTWKIWKIVNFLERFVIAQNQADLHEQDPESFMYSRLHPRKFPRQLGINYAEASTKTVDLVKLTPDYLYLFLNRKYTSSFIQDEPVMDSLITRYPQSRFAWQEGVIAPFLFKSSPFSFSWWKEGLASFENKKLIFQRPFVSSGVKNNLVVTKEKTIVGQNLFFPNKEYIRYPTYLKPDEEHMLVNDFVSNYYLLWQERQRLFNWHFRNAGFNYSGTARIIKKGTLKCRSRLDFSSARFSLQHFLRSSFLTLELPTSANKSAWKPQDLLGDYHGVLLWNRSIILYPLTVFAFYANFFNDISISFQLDLREWLYWSQDCVEFYSFFVMLISWSFFGIYI